MTGSTRRRPSGSGKCCGFLAAFAFLVVVALPVLFIFSFGMSPCEEGPCNPDGASDYTVVAGVMLVLAILTGMGTWHLVAWWESGSAASHTGRETREE